MTSRVLVIWQFLLTFAFYAAARPLVRNVRSDAEFRRLISFHAKETGLPVIFDFYSDGCGPCRQIAPFYKSLAKQHRGDAVFAKVDVNFNRETSSSQRIRSMPTFQFYQDGKKRHQFSGGDRNQLQSWINRLTSEFRENNVKVTPEALEEFYQEFAPGKATKENIDRVMKKAGDVGGGKGHKSLIRALQKKYGKTPKTLPRYDPRDSSSKRKKEKTEKTQRAAGSAPNAKPDQPNLHLASFEELEAELEKRRVERAEEDDEETDDDEDEERPIFEVFVPQKDLFAERLTVVGAGPAGLSAAIYAARAGLNPVVIAPPSGGQLSGKGVLVENYPGLATDLTGPAVVYEMQKQAAKYGAVFYNELVTSVQFSDRIGEPHKILTNETTVESHAVIISTGANSNWLEVEGEELFKGGGVSACATCDGYLFRDLPVVVIGGGDTAMEEAMHLATMSSKVTVIHRKDFFTKASKILANRVLQHEKIDVIWNTTVVAFEGDVEPKENEQPLLTHLVLKRTNSSETFHFPCSGAFVAIGHTPNTWMFKGQVEIDAVGYIRTRNASTKTSVEGVFAAGDVADSVYRQAVTSAGTGAMAALDAERWLQEHGIQDERQKEEEDLMREIIQEMEMERMAKLAAEIPDNVEECDDELI